MFRNYKPGPFAPGIHDVGRDSPTKAYLPARNGRPPEQVPPGFLAALGGGTIPEPPIEATSTGRRKALANWIASKDNPLTARVMVNRDLAIPFRQGSGRHAQRSRPPRRTALASGAAGLAGQPSLSTTAGP